MIAYGVLAEGAVCARVEDRVLDLSGLDPVFAAPSLNAFLARGPEFWAQTRERLSDGREVSEPRLGLPVAVGDYVDFFSSLHHAANMGRMLRPQGEPLTPNWRHLPIAYHGRSGTLVPKRHAGAASVRPAAAGGGRGAELRAQHPP